MKTTPNLNLTLYEPDDSPKWVGNGSYQELGTYNGDMQKIDAAFDEIFINGVFSINWDAIPDKQISTEKLADAAVTTDKINTTLTWTIPTLLSGWTHYVSGTYHSASYTKDILGFVHLRGTIGGGTTTSGTVLFNLPVGYRPSKTIFLSVANSLNTTSSKITIQNNGNVVINNIGNNTWLSLDGISFHPS